MKFHFFLVGFFLTSIQLMGQHVYETKAVFNPLQKQIEVRQNMVFYNHSSTTLYRIFINDWNNAYAGSGSPLSKKLSDDYNFRFEKSSASDKGKTNILYFSAGGRSLKWKRVEKQPDIIELAIPEGIPSGSNFSILTDYNLKLPSDRFTGYGISSKNELELNNWQLHFAFLFNDGTWALDSNLGFDDISLQPATHQLSFSYPKEMHLAISVSGSNSVDGNHVNWTGKRENIKKIDLELNHHSDFDTLRVGKNEFVTNLAEKSIHLKEAEGRLHQLMEFVTSYFPIGNTQTLFLQSTRYNRHPIVGLELLYDTLKPLPKDQILSLKIAKTLIYNLVYENTLTTYRNQPWIVDGLAQYLFMKYVDTHQSELKLLGNLDNIPGFKNYEFSKAFFNDRYALLAGFATRQNVAQPLNTTNDQLSKYNRKIANPARIGLGLRLLEKSEGEGLVDRCLKAYFLQNFDKNQKLSFNDIVLEETDGGARWFFNEFLSEEDPADYAIKKDTQNDNVTIYELINKSKSKAPIPLALYKGDSLVHSTWMSGGLHKQNLRLNNDFADVVVINPDQDVVEINLNNNNAAAGAKKFKVSLFEDIPSSHSKQWFVVPGLSFNAYDGLMTGLMLNNGLALKHPFFFSILPQYSIKTNKLNGEANFLFRKYFQSQSLSQIQFGASFLSQHYAPNLRYYRFSPSLNLFFRPYGINDNRRSALGFRYISLYRENDLTQSRLPGYNLGMITYVKSNYSSAETRALFSEIQIGNSFSKLSASYTHRKFYREAKQFYFRVFGGTFLYNNDGAFYNFGVSRVNDYAFNYNLFGRSEDSGFYSQQFVMAEGGFKSFVDIPQANKWMLATNLSTTIWRALEVYADLGIVKNKNMPAASIYDAGLGINIIQNYFQLYFPVYSNLGWEVDERQYASKIRFTLAADPEELFGLFTRSWF